MDPASPRKWVCSLTSYRSQQVIPWELRPPSKMRMASPELDVHATPPGDVAGEDIERVSNLHCVLPNGRGQQFRVRGDVRDQTDTRAPSTTVQSASSPTTSTASVAGTLSFFMISGCRAAAGSADTDFRF